MTFTRRLTLLLIATLLVITACGSDDDRRAAVTSDGEGRPGVAVRAAVADDDGSFMVYGESDAVDAAPRPAGPLRAGSVDDNADFDRFLTYLDGIHQMGIPLRDYDPTGRIVIEVVGSSGLPVAGADVVVRADGDLVARIRTTADGTVRFHPALYGASAVQQFEIEGGDQLVTVSPGSTVQIRSSEAGGADGRIPVDILFLLDATGSMGDEIDQLKENIDRIAARIDAFQSNPDVRFGMTLYRDIGDEFLTRTTDFTSDVAAFRRELAQVVAAGGGDYPEALDEGLAEALAKPQWRDAGETLQFIFLVADAPPQIGRNVQVPYPASIRDAIGRGVKIFPIASSDSDDQAEAVFRQLAQATGARFVFLSYGAGGAATGGSTDISSTDYQELALDDLVVRFVAEELGALTGQTGQILDNQQQPTTTRPDGQ